MRLKLEFTDGEFRQLATQLSGVQRTDLALALAALWLGRLCNRMDYAAGFIFMRRLGSAALTVGGVQIFLSYANQYTKPFNEVTNVITQIQTAYASARRMFALLDAREHYVD